MDLDLKYPDAKPGDRPEPFLVREGLHATCHAHLLNERRSVRSYWRYRGHDTPGLPVCSEGCFAILKDWDPPPNQDPEYVTKYPLGFRLEPLTGLENLGLILQALSEPPARNPNLMTEAEMRALAEKDPLAKLVVEARLGPADEPRPLTAEDVKLLSEPPKPIVVPFPVQIDEPQSQ